MQRKLIIFGVLAVSFVSGAAGAQAGPPPEAWESRRYDQFTYLASHNAFANHQQDYKRLTANQYVSIANQLNGGVTTFLMDIWLVRQHKSGGRWRVEYYTSGRGPTGSSFKEDDLELVVGHGLDVSGGGYFLLDGYPSFNPRFRQLRVDLETIADFMQAHPKIPITLFFESYTDQPDMVEHEFRVAGAWSRIFWADRPNKGFKAKDGTDWEVKRHGWPPLAVMGYYGKMLVVFSDSRRDGLPKDHDFVSQNVYGNESLHSSSVWHTRSGSLDIGDLSQSLLFMNRMPSFILSSQAIDNNESLGFWDFDKLNNYSNIWGAAETVTQNALRLPNFVNVDYVNYGKNGGPPRAVDELNTKGWDKAHPINHKVWALQQPNSKGWNRKPVTVHFSTFGSAELISRVYQVFGDSVDTGFHSYSLHGHHDSSEVIFSREGQYSISSYSLGVGVDPWDNDNLVIGRSGTVSTILRIDSSKPTLDVSGIPSLWSPTDITVRVSANDLHSGVAGTYWRWNKRIETRYTAPVVFSDEGINNLTIRSIDNADNTNFLQFELKIDKTSPTIGHSESGRFVTLTAADTLSGIKQVRYSINALFNNNLPYNAPFLVPGWGLTRIGYHSQDWATNAVEDSFNLELPYDQTGRVSVVEGRRKYDSSTGEWGLVVVLTNTSKVASAGKPVWLLIAPKTGGTTLLTKSQPVTEPSERSSRAVDCGDTLFPGQSRKVELRFKGPASGIAFRTKVVAGPGPL